MLSHCHDAWKGGRFFHSTHYRAALSATCWVDMCTVRMVHLFNPTCSCLSPSVVCVNRQICTPVINLTSLFVAWVCLRRHNASVNERRFSTSCFLFFVCERGQVVGSCFSYSPTFAHVIATPPNILLLPPVLADFRWLQQLKFQSALAAPGEAVGVLAAQSVGEPSTQVGLPRWMVVCVCRRYAHTTRMRGSVLRLTLPAEDEMNCT
jgi:hypothetical protein